MLFDDNNMDLAFLNMTGINEPNVDILSAKEGFLRGNMFKDEYKPYKNLAYVNLVPKTEKEAKMFNVMQYAFAITDLNLYLDLHPEDTKAYNLFKKFIEEEKKAKKEYEKNYGPLELCNDLGARYNWIEDWPWEKRGGSQYV